MNRLHHNLRLSILLILTCCVVGCQTYKVEQARLFENALTRFEQAKSEQDYLASAAIYQQLVDEGIVSGGLLFNQGNAFARGGQPGRTIACYRQAQRYRPGDPYLQASLDSLAADDTTSAKSPLEHLLFWQDWIGYPQKFQLAFAALMATLVITTIAIIRPLAGTRIAAISLGILTLVAMASASYDYYRFDVVKRGIVAAAGVVARKGNSESYEPAFTEPLPETTEFVVRELRGDWVLAVFPENKTGWLPKKTVVVY